MNSRLRRVLQGVVTLAGVVLLVFFLVRLTGDPAIHYLPLDASAEARERFSELRGFNDPLYQQLWRFITDVLQGDLGESLRRQEPALQVVLRALPATMTLAVFSVALSTIAAIVVGAWSATHPMSKTDRAASVFSVGAASIPDFWLALVLVFGVAIQGDLLPTSGTGTWMHWILPVVTLSARPFGLLAQVVRGAVIESLEAPYINAARGKGLPERLVVARHAVRNAMLPTVTVAGDLAVSVINGAVIVETVFGIPGVGGLLIDSIYARDFAIVQATVLVTGAIIIALNVVVDFTYEFADPRLKASA